MTKEVNPITGSNAPQITLKQHKPATGKAADNGINTPVDSDTVDHNPLQKLIFPFHVLHEASRSDTRQKLKDFSNLLDIPKDDIWGELKGKLVENFIAELPKNENLKENELTNHLTQYKNRIAFKARLLTKQIIYLILEYQVSNDLQESLELKLLKDDFLTALEAPKVPSEDEKSARDFLQTNIEQKALIFRLARNNHKFLFKALEEEDALISSGNNNTYESSGLMKELRFIRDQHPERLVELEKLAELKDLSALESPNHLSLFLESTETNVRKLLESTETERNDFLEEIEKELADSSNYKIEKLGKEQICNLTQKQVLYICGKIFEKEESSVKLMLAELEKERIETAKLHTPKSKRSLVKLIAVLGLIGTLSLTSVYVLVNNINEPNQEEINRLKAKEVEEFKAKEIANTKSQILSKISPYLEINYAKYHEEATKRLASKAYPSEPYDSTDIKEWTFQQRFVRYPLFRGGLNERYFRPLYVILAPSLTEEQKHDVLSGKVQGLAPEYVKNFPDSFRTPLLFNNDEWKKVELMLSDSVLKPISPYAMGYMMAYLEPPTNYSLKKSPEGKEFLQESTPESTVLPNLIPALIKNGTIKASEKEKYYEAKEYIKVDPFSLDVIATHKLMQDRILQKREEITKPFNDLAALVNELRAAKDMKTVTDIGEKIDLLVKFIEKDCPPRLIRPALPYIADAEIILNELGSKITQRYQDVINRNTFRARLEKK